MSKKLPTGSLDQSWRNAENWKAGLIYHCASDPRIVVPKRQKWRGWTLNFAHSKTWALLILMIAILAFPIVKLMTGVQSESWIWYTTLACVIVSMIAGSVYLSSPNRHEENG